MNSRRKNLSLCKPQSLTWEAKVYLHLSLTLSIGYVDGQLHVLASFAQCNQLNQIMLPPSLWYKHNIATAFLYFFSHICTLAFSRGLKTICTVLRHVGNFLPNYVFRAPYPSRQHTCIFPSWGP